MFDTNKATRRKFKSMIPAEHYPSVAAYLDAYVAEIAAAQASIDREQLDLAEKIMSAALRRDATIFCCGNGGSAAIANHLACDHQKGISTDTDLRPRVISLSSNVE